MFQEMEYFGSTVIGEKGQVVVPAELRKKFGIEPKDKLLVLAGEKMGAWAIILVKSDVLSKLVRQIFGGDLQDILRDKNKEKKSIA
nr:AbrB/MazE/SpoVT family DNA-binding domain-containing protein [Candidatus Njordarchaeota archaeon]